MGVGRRFIIADANRAHADQIAGPLNPLHLTSRPAGPGTQQGTIRFLRLLKVVVGQVFMTPKCKDLVRLFDNVAVKLDGRGVSHPKGAGEP